jgi:hypothetical protein
MSSSDSKRTGWTFEYSIHVVRGAKGAKNLREGAPPPTEPLVVGTVPRVTRLVALAHRFHGYLQSGTATDYADLARLAGVTRARITQIMNLLHLAPDIQEALLELPRTVEGRDLYLETDLRPIAAVPDWSKQRRMWGELQKAAAQRRSA